MRIGNQKQVKNVVGLLVATFLFLSFTQPVGAQAGTAQMLMYKYVYVDGDGNANCEQILRLPPSKLADISKMSATLNLGGAKSTSIAGVRDAWAKYGLSITEASSEIRGLGVNDTYEEIVTYRIRGLAKRIDDKWVINFQLVNPTATAQETIEKARFVQSMLRVIPLDNVTLSGESVIVLPDGAEVLNKPELMLSRTIDYGGGTYETSLMRVTERDGRPAVVSTSSGVITTTPITITPEEYIQAALSPNIEYRVLVGDHLPYLVVAGVAVMLAVIGVLLLRRRRAKEWWAEW